MPLQVYKISNPGWQVINKAPIQYAIVDPLTKEILIFNKDSAANPLFYGIEDAEMAWTFYQIFTSQGYLTTWLDFLIVRGVGEQEVTEIFEKYRKPKEDFRFPDF